jgi:hypothetical protein
MYECDVRDEDLVAYADDYLTGGRRELVEAHLQVRCPSCRRRLDDFRAVDEILLTTSPVVDMQRSQQELRRWLDAVDTSKSPRRSLRLIGVVAALSLLSVIFWPGALDADSLVGEFLHFGQVQVRRIPGMPAEGVPVKHVATAQAELTLTFPGIEPTDLPNDLIQVERSVPSADRLELLFRNQSGLAILLTQSPADGSTITVAPTSHGYFVPIANTDVLVLPDPWPESVSAMIWEHDGVVFELLVTESWGGLPLADATAIVMALLNAAIQQDR